MQYRSIGDLSVSEIGLGGEYFQDLSDGTVRDIIDCAIENGVNILDLFLPYSGVRDAVGKALIGRRDKMRIQGHIGVTLENGQYARTRELKLAKASFEDLMARLKTDYIDFGMIHYCDDFKDYVKTLENGLVDYARALKREGKILKIGMSTHNPKVALRALDDGFLDMLMFSVNPAWDIERASEDIDELIKFRAMREDGEGMEPEREKLYRTCAARGVAITVMKAYGGGLLLNKEQSPFEQALTPVQCISYALSRPGVVSVLPGVSNKSELEAALAYNNASQSERDYSAIAKNAKYALTGKCMYCNHCRPCAVNIDIGMVTKLYDLASGGRVPESVLEHYRALEAGADKCIECGQCEPNCPFGVHIIENMRKAKELFG